MADDAKLIKYIAFRKRLQRDIKLIFHKDKQLDWDDPDYSSKALNDYVEWHFSRMWFKNYFVFQLRKMIIIVKV